jgi:glycosyltransferase involved in cell wall biosynthesis
MLNIALCYNDVNRFWTVGSYIQKELALQQDTEIVAHCVIAEDSGILEAQCDKQIDLVLVIDDGVTHFKLHHHTGRFLPKTKFAIWLSDLHRPDWASWRLQMIKEFHYHHVFYAQKSFKEIVMQQGYSEQEVSYLPHAVDSEIFKPMPWITKKYDMGLVGYQNTRRQRAIKVLKEFVNFRHFDSVWAWSAARAINECKIGFNMSVEDSDVCNMRVFETLACEIPLLTNYSPNCGLEDLFGKDFENKMLVYSTEQEMKEKAVRLIACSDLRKQIAYNGRQHVLSFHTYRNRTNSILGTMGFELLQNH